VLGEGEFQIFMFAGSRGYKSYEGQRKKGDGDHPDGGVERGKKGGGPFYMGKKGDWPQIFFRTGWKYSQPKKNYVNLGGASNRPGRRFRILEKGVGNVNDKERGGRESKTKTEGGKRRAPVPFGPIRRQGQITNYGEPTVHDEGGKKKRKKTSLQGLGEGE